MKDIGKELRPAVVAGKPKQAGEASIRERWRWVEPSVWTERMLMALEEGVKGPNTHFAGCGLFTFTAAHELVCQSRRA